jgi:hypothetical protein
MADNNTSNVRVAKERILSLPIEKIGKSLIEELFAAYHDKTTNKYMPAQYNTTDQIQLTPQEYKFVGDKPITTTLGRLIMNRFILEKSGVIQHIGYWNNTLDKKGIGKLDAAVVELMITDKIDADTYASYIDHRDILGFWVTTFLAASLSASLLRQMPDVEKRKKELLKEKADDINSNNPVKQIMASNSIENELLGIVKKNLESDPGYDLYKSGDGNLENQYKTINVMRGAVFNEVTKRYDVVGASLMNGIDKKDIPAFSNSVLEGAYPSAIGTAEAGYMGKIFMAIMQTEHIDPNPKSDCGTKMTIPVTITNDNKGYFLYRNFNINGKVVLSDIENIGNFVGKTVNMYSPQCCTHESICAKCAGQIFHKMGVTNVGLLTSDPTDKLLNLKLKSKHDLSKKAGGVPKNYIFGKDNPYYEYQDGILKPKGARMRCFIPRMFEDFQGFYVENTTVSSMGIFPVKFYDKNDKEIFHTTMIVPCQLTLNIYSDIQETPEHYILTYDPGAEVCALNINQSYVNAEFYLNQVLIYSSTPQLPYNLITELMWRCLEINHVDLTGISMVYELMARSLCKIPGTNKPFAMLYGKGGVDPMSYEKLRYREAVQKTSVLSGILFEDISMALDTGLSQTLNGVAPIDTPLEKIIRA